jgi:hypothetical protein
MDPSGMTTAQCLYLSNLDMEAVEQADVQLIADYAELWLANRTRTNRSAWTGPRCRQRSVMTGSARHATPGARSTSLALPSPDPSLSSPDLLLGGGGAWWKAMI